ncbi:MAG: hypothetical protein ACK5CW_13595 [Verrucomicrobiota bacterium]
MKVNRRQPWHGSASRRQFLHSSALTLGASLAEPLLGQESGERPAQDPAVTILNPRARVPVSLIIDDSTCLVNLNKFAIPQFAEANPGSYQQYPWRQWPDEIPDDFVRKFADWSSEHGVKGKYSIVPYPACVGRIDLGLPGWTRSELNASLALVRERIMPNWDIHPEMVTHTRVIDLKTGHPYQEVSRKFMENWNWCGGRSADEIAAYMSYALTILRNAGLHCEGITTPGGFGGDARPQLARATFESCRDVFQTEIPHYFRDLSDKGTDSVAPLVQNVSGLGSDDPRCVVHVRGCTGDWTGGWDCSVPTGADAFLTTDGRSGRLAEVIARGEPAVMVCHWTGIYWNGLETGFGILKEVARRLRDGFPGTQWMKLSEIARYWAARELTRTAWSATERQLRWLAPFACPDFTFSIPLTAGIPQTLREVPNTSQFTEGTWCRDGKSTIICINLPKGQGSLQFTPAE